MHANAEGVGTNHLIVDFGSLAIRYAVVAVDSQGKTIIKEVGTGLEGQDAIRGGVPYRVDVIADFLSELCRRHGVHQLHGVMAPPSVRVEVIQPDAVEVGHEPGIISDDEVEQLRRRAESALRKQRPNDHLLSVYPRRYFIDEAEEYGNVRGTYGKVLRGEFVGFYIRSDDFQRYEVVGRKVPTASRWISSMELLERLVPRSAFSSGGVAIIDLGHHTTGVYIYHEGRPTYAQVIPLGGRHVLEDMQTAFRLPPSAAAWLLHNKGTAEEVISPHVYRIRMKDGIEPPRLVPAHALSQVIGMRIREIFSWVQRGLMANDGMPDVTRVFLTGGLTHLQDIEAAAAAILEKEAGRLPNHLPEAAFPFPESKKDDPEWSVIGAAIHYVAEQVLRSSPPPPPSPLPQPEEKEEVKEGSSWFERARAILLGNRSLFRGIWNHLTGWLLGQRTV